ncbi:unnamed protein product [Porites lobata]|uniref:Uncharacterized protein n=1 Tax=Porites lobata TaxID=104759 RepID=A0ABN8QN52_9CNID|nr:unnamed protein product [Porites lobata]
MLANSPFAGTKRGTVQRGRKWNEISERLLQAEAPKFKVDQRGVRESTPELTEVEQALEDLIVREDEADRDQQETAAQKRKVKEDKKDAEEVRKRAMERLGDRMKRSEIEGKGRKEDQVETTPWSI